MTSSVGWNNSAVGSKSAVRRSFETRSGVFEVYDHIDAAGKQTFNRSVQAGASSQDISHSAVKISIASSIGSATHGEILEHICFNCGKELRFMSFQNFISTRSFDAETRKLYKGTVPTCHDVAITEDSDSVGIYKHVKSNDANSDATLGAMGSNVQRLPAVHNDLASEHQQQYHFVLVGFAAGQVQLFETSMPQQYVFYNDNRLIDDSRVCAVKWVPSSSSKFLVAHTSGHIYLYDSNLPCDAAKTVYVNCPQIGSQMPLTISMNRSRQHNPRFRVSLGSGSHANSFAFSPCGSYLALACQDGILRVIKWTDNQSLRNGNSSADHYDIPTLETRLFIRSFFGGLLCVSWSPDGRYLATGGEDDLVTVISFVDSRVVCRGQGHRSWISSVAFDHLIGNSLPTGSSTLHSNATQLSSACYRLASVGQDTLLCVWEFEDPMLTAQLLVQKRLQRTRNSVVGSTSTPANNISTFPGVIVTSPSSVATCNGVQRAASTVTSNTITVDADPLYQSCDADKFGMLHVAAVTRSPSASYTPSPSSTVGSASGTNLAGILKFWSRSRSKKGSKKTSKQRQPLPLEQGAASEESTEADVFSSQQPLYKQELLLGTEACPRLAEVPLLTPVVLKKISLDPLTDLVFLKDYLITASQSGCLTIWARPTPTANVNLNNGTASKACGFSASGISSSSSQRQQELASAL